MKKQTKKSVIESLIEAAVPFENGTKMILPETFEDAGLYVSCLDGPTPDWRYTMRIARALGYRMDAGIAVYLYPIKRSVGFALLALVLLSASCTPMRKVAHLLKPCQPNQELAAEYACRTYKFRGANAGLIIVGDTWTFTSDRQDNKARWVGVESLPREVLDCR